MIPKIGTQKGDYEDKTLGNSSFITCMSVSIEARKGVDRRVKIALSICSLIDTAFKGLYCSCSVVESCLTLQSHGPNHARFCSPLTPGVYSN